MSHFVREEKRLPPLPDTPIQAPLKTLSKSSVIETRFEFAKDVARNAESPGWIDPKAESATRPSAAPPNGGYGFGVFLAHYLANRSFAGATNLQYAFVGSLSISSGLLMSPIATICVRRLGTKPTMYMGVMLQSAGLVCASFAQEVWQLFLTQSILFGVGLGFLFIPSVGIVPQWFSTRRSLANGLATAGSGIGGVLYSFAAGAMIRSLGLQWAFRILGIIAFVVNAASTTLIKDRNKEVGSTHKAFDTNVLKLPDYQLLLAFGSFSVLGYIVLLFSLANYANRIGLGASEAASISAAFNLGQAFGRPMIGYFSDRTGRFNMAVLMTFLTGVFSLAIWTSVKSFAGLLVFAILGGAVGGTIWATIAPLTVEVVGLGSVASALSILWITVFTPCTFSVPIALEIVNGTGSYLGAQLFAGFMYVTAAVCLGIVRARKIRSARRQRLATLEAKGFPDEPDAAKDWLDVESKRQKTPWWKGGGIHRWKLERV
ncbi:major facilitator superfamily domain-containing protein [Hirsutella rhossiliensis]|uniref:Major facilitator superfamily domain-containing protein n=1 Tax=Hirsutella rhossiliensis TaxID=111463 RepID=A0A9P8MU07_9HYPO|nr:major facilitator superfamily domain-containing protein [Hirsutella rhossiliensis]KAH0961382.1 major facilitator superfamily domain-containing protein [Hirsutella rhossiliensis]